MTRIAIANLRIFITGCLIFFICTGTLVSSGGPSQAVFAATPPTVSAFSPTGGPAGTAVTITGTNLSGATEVSLNGVKATITSNSATQIVTAIPPAATTGAIKIITAGGTVTTTTSFIVTTQANPIDDSQFYVRQHYRDFLNREPDASGLNFWINNIDSCGTDANCRAVKRVDTSAAFFLSIEFQQTGYLVYKIYKASFGNLANKPVPVVRANFMADTTQIQTTPAQVVVGQGAWATQIETNKVAFTHGFVQRSAFLTAYPLGMPAATYVDKLFVNAGFTPATQDRQAAITAYGAGDQAGRAAALRAVAENTTLQKIEFNKAFVLMQYFGYLHRDPDALPDADFSGFNFWLSKLNQFNGNYVQAEMVKAFTSATEYTASFLPPKPLSINSLSASSVIPMSPLYIKTTGLSFSTPVTVKFADTGGFSETESPVRIQGDGTILVGTPIYVDPKLHQIGPGSISVTLTQGSQSTTPVALNIQDIPALSTYGTKLGEITHYKLMMDAMLVGQKINRLQAFGRLPGRTVDTSPAVKTLQSQLAATIKMRSDVDRVGKNNSLVINTGASVADGTAMKFDKNSLDMMDRVNALFLQQTYGTLPTKTASGQTVPMLEALSSPELLGPVPTDVFTPLVKARVVSHYRRNRSLAKPVGEVVKQSAIAPEGSAFEKFLVGLTVTKDLLDHTVSVTNAAIKQTWMDTTAAMAKSAAVLMDFTKTNIEFGGEATVLSKKLGLYGAILGNITTIGNAFGADAAFIVGVATGNQPLIDAVTEDLSKKETYNANLAALVDLSTAGLSSFTKGFVKDTSDLLSGASSLWTSGKEAAKLIDESNGESAFEKVNDTTESMLMNFPRGDEHDFGLVQGQANVTTTLGDMSPPSEIELTSNGIDFDTIADPSGSFETIVTLQVPGFNYGHVGVDILDPLTDTVLGFETVDITAMGGSMTPITIPPVNGQCIDDDADTPDGDDPDCD